MKAASLLLSATFAIAWAQEDEVGRYQLFNGQTRTLLSSKGTVGSVDEHNVFRLDTKTGRAWYLSSVADTNGIRTSWIEIPDPDEGQKKAVSLVRTATEIEKRQKFIAWAETHRNGFTGRDDSGLEVSYTAEQLAARRAKIEEELKTWEAIWKAQINPPSRPK